MWEVNICNKHTCLRMLQVLPSVDTMDCSKQDISPDEHHSPWHNHVPWSDGLAETDTLGGKCAHRSDEWSECLYQLHMLDNRMPIADQAPYPRRHIPGEGSVDLSLHQLLENNMAAKKRYCSCSLIMWCLSCSKHPSQMLSLCPRVQQLPTWCFRLPLGIFLVSPSLCHTWQNRSIRKSAAAYTSSAMLLTPLPLVYSGRNHCMKSWSKRLPLRAWAITRISGGVAHTGTFLKWNR